MHYLPKVVPFEPKYPNELAIISCQYLKDHVIGTWSFLSSTIISSPIFGSLQLLRENTSLSYGMPRVFLYSWLLKYKTCKVKGHITFPKLPFGLKIHPKITIKLLLSWNFQQSIPKSRRYAASFEIESILVLCPVETLETL